MMNSVLKRLCAFLFAFGIGIAIYHALPQRPAPIELKASLVPCRMISMYEQELNPNWQPRPCDYFLAVEQTEIYSMNKAIPFIDRDPYLFEGNCGTLTVSITSDNTIYLNSHEELGDASQPGQLGQRLQSILDGRVRIRAYREDIENNPNFRDMTEEERIEPLTVFLRPACEVKYEDVLRVIDVIESAGEHVASGNRIALQVSECGNVNETVHEEASLIND